MDYVATLMMIDTKNLSLTVGWIVVRKMQQFIKKYLYLLWNTQAST